MTKHLKKAQECYKMTDGVFYSIKVIYERTENNERIKQEIS